MSILAFQYPVFQPAMRIISGITNDFPAVVTTTFNHQYINGIVIRLIVPPGYGMVEANQLFGTIVVLSDTTFSIDIDTRYFNQFVVPMGPNSNQSSQAIPFGEDNATLLAAYTNVLPY